MSSTGILIQEQRDGWKVSGASPDSVSTSLPSADPDEVAQSVLAFAGLHSLDQGRLIIAVDSNAVLFATIPASDDRMANSSQSLRYALESALPIDAESIVADSFAKNNKSIGMELTAVAMEVSHVQRLVNSLEQLQLKVQFIVPYSMLVFEQALDDNSLTAPSVSLWLPSGDEPFLQAEILVLDADQTVRSWRMMEMEPSTIERNLSFVTTDFSSYPIFVFGDAGELTQRIAASHANSQWLSIDRERSSKSRAAMLLSGRGEPWIDLRRDELATHDRWRRHRGAMTRLALAMSLFVVAVCGTLIWRANQYVKLAGQIDQQQQDLFRRTFPGQRIPAAILGRLRSEHAKAMGVRKSDDSSSTPQSILGILPQIIESLAVDFPFEVKELRIENGTIAIELELASQKDAGYVAAELFKHGFTVEPPATTLVNGDRVLASYIASIGTSSGFIKSTPEGMR